MTDTQVQTKGRGFIRVSASDELLAGLGHPETPEQWHKALLLPDSYEVERVERVNRNGSFTFELDTVGCDVFNIFVQHDAIPPLEDYAPMPEVVPHYYVISKEDKVGLARIDINQWDGTKWEAIGTEIYFEVGLPDKYEAHFPPRCEAE